MNIERSERLFYVCAPIDADVDFWQSLSGPDWNESLDVLELDREQLALLNSVGLWDDINANCEFRYMNIDLYEEAEIPAENLACLLASIARAREASSDNPELLALIERMHKLVIAAQSRGAAVLFLF